MKPLCPKCNAQIARVTLTSVAVEGGHGGRALHGAAYACPHCATLLSVGVDPVAVMTDTVDAVVAQVTTLLRTRP